MSISLSFIEALNDDSIASQTHNLKRISLAFFGIVLQGRIKLGMEAHKIYGIGPGELILRGSPIQSGFNRSAGTNQEQGSQSD